jgi:FkbM family methyltransferase
MNVYDGLKWHYKLCGIRGVSAEAAFRIFGWPRELTVTPPGIDHSVSLRLRTSDYCAYKDVLVCKDKKYDPGIPDFSPRVIVDAGANIGMASIGFARKYPLATIFAIEPEPSNFTALLRNVSSYGSIVPIQAALWKEDGEVSLGPSSAHPRGAFQVADSGQTRVRAITVSTLMREKGINFIDLLKLDIEGAEKEVFEACDWIEAVQVIAIELHDRVKPGCRAAVQAAATKFRSHEQGDITVYFK